MYSFAVKDRFLFYFYLFFKNIKYTKFRSLALRKEVQLTKCEPIIDKYILDFT